MNHNVSTLFWSMEVSIDQSNMAEASSAILFIIGLRRTMPFSACVCRYAYAYAYALVKTRLKATSELGATTATAKTRK